MKATQYLEFRETSLNEIGDIRGRGLHIICENIMASKHSTCVYVSMESLALQTIVGLPKFLENHSWIRGAWNCGWWRYSCSMCSVEYT
jgi:hypothetical protein